MEAAAPAEEALLEGEKARAELMETDRKLQMSSRRLQEEEEDLEKTKLLLQEALLQQLALQEKTGIRKKFR